MVKRVAGVALAAIAALFLAGGAAAAPKLKFKSAKVQGIPGAGELPWAEPRNAVGPDGWTWVVTNRHKEDGAAIVLGAKDGLHFKDEGAEFASRWLVPQILDVPPK